jgi:hypothetical protein
MVADNYLKEFHHIMATYEILYCTVTNPRFKKPNLSTQYEQCEGGNT